jgi:protein ImuB
LLAPAKSKPRIIVGERGAARRLTAVNDAAARLGLEPDMPLADAQAMHPALVRAEADPEQDRLLLEKIADWCDRYTPLIGLHPPDSLILDISGCAHLFGGETALCRDLVGRLGEQGFKVRAAIADTVGCAAAVARFSQTGLEADIVSPGATKAALMPLPLAGLRLSGRVVRALAQVGLKRVVDIVDQPRAPLAARFGISLVRRLDQALGDEDEPIAPRRPLPPYVVERRFGDPIAIEADILGTIEHLAHELARMMERRGEGARLVQLALFRTDGRVHRIAIGTAAPLRDTQRLRRLFADKLAALGDECDPGFGFDVVRLSVGVTQRCDPVQTGLESINLDGDLAHLIDRLSARFGPRRVMRLVPQDTHIPEFAIAALPAQTLLHQTRSHHAAQEPALACGPLSGQDSLAPVRPIRLFERPEPIEAVAEVPDGPPVRFRWRHVLHEVMTVEGPERIAMEWWRDETGQALTRDYFRVESRQGARVWLYREGLYGRETIQPRWFLHGLFA